MTEDELAEARAVFVREIAHDENLAAWARRYGPTLLNAARAEDCPECGLNPMTGAHERWCTR